MAGPVSTVDENRKRRLWRAHHEANDRRFAKWKKRGLQYPPPPPLPFPEACRDMTCGAKTKAGTPCKRKDLYRSGRCALHGGKSTGPTSDEGKARSAKNGLIKYQDKSADVRTP